jgi:hypothetical protein
MPFAPGHKYHPRKDSPLPDDPLDTIEAGLVSMMHSKDADERLKAYKLYVSLLGKHPKKRTVLEPTIERLVSWLYSLADINQQPISTVIRSLTQSGIAIGIQGLSQTMEGRHSEPCSPLVSQELSGTGTDGYA